MAEITEQDTAMRRRQIYAEHRIPELQREMAALMEERTSGPPPGPAGDPERQKALNRRRVYVNERIAVLREELRRLRASQAEASGHFTAKRAANRL